VAIEELFGDDPNASTPANVGGKNGGPKPAAKAKAKAAVASPEPLVDPFAEEASVPNADFEALTAESSSEPSGAAPLMAAPTSPAASATPRLPERIVEAVNGNGSAPDMFAGEGLTFERRYTRAGEDVYGTTEWDLRTAAITGEGGNVVFEQKDCEIPRAWSMLATNVVVSKYFRGKVGTPDREHSVKQLISRVADTIYKWGKKDNYFATEADADAFHDELKYLLLHQYMAFNSPVWFNLGVPGEKPQVSACQPYDALVSTPQGLIPIGKLVQENAVGIPVYDAHGTTRIVATKANGSKPVLRLHTKAGYTLDVTADHFVWKKTGGGKAAGEPTGKFVEAGTLQEGDRLVWKRTPLAGKSLEGNREEAEAALAGWLQSDGFVGQYESGTNRSLTIEAMVVNSDEEQWVCASIAQVFGTAHSHTRNVVTRDKNLECQRIRLYGEELRPFVDKWDLRTRGMAMEIPFALYTAPYTVAAAYLRSVFQAEGYVALRENAKIGLDMISEGVVRGVQKLLLRFGIYSRVRFKADPRNNRKGCWSLLIMTLGDRKRFAQDIGFIGAAKQEKLLESLSRAGLEEGRFKTLQIERIENRGEMEVYDIQTESGEYLSGNIRVHNCFINSVDDTMESILTLAKTEGMLFKWGSGTGTNLSVLRSSQEGLKGGGTASGPVSFMRGFDAFAGAIKCLTPDAYVYTDCGLRTLGEVIDTNLPPGFHENDSVVLATKDGPTRISHVYVSPKAETYRVTLARTNLGLRGTADHPVLTLTPDFELVWKRLPDLAKGDRIAVSRRSELWPKAAPSLADFVPTTRYAKKNLSFPREMTPHLARLLGYMVSEGCMDEERFRFCSCDTDTFADFLSCVEGVFGVDPSKNVRPRVHPKTGVTTWLFEACWTNAVRFLKHVGLTTAASDAKTIPCSIRQSPRALVTEFLRAYFEGDGHVSPHVYAASASKQLLSEIQLLLLTWECSLLCARIPSTAKCTGACICAANRLGRLFGKWASCPPGKKPWLSLWAIRTQI
jgi:intein/homing endonuclease